jgi:hypothetical protein
MEAQFLGLFQLCAQLLDFDHIGEAQVGGAVDKRKRSGGFGELLPDKLEHQELVKIGVEQRPRNGVQLPVVVMGAPREVDNHDVTTLPHGERSSEAGPIAPISRMDHVRSEAATPGRSWESGGYSPKLDRNCTARATSPVGDLTSNN